MHEMEEWFLKILKEYLTLIFSTFLSNQRLTQFRVSGHVGKVRKHVPYTDSMSEERVLAAVNIDLTPSATKNISIIALINIGVAGP